jgi:hypothetical protein
MLEHHRGEKKKNFQAFMRRIEGLWAYGGSLAGRDRTWCEATCTAARFN